MSETMAHPIRVVARRTGLTPALIRIWEKRYGVIEPRRTATGRRVYSDGDIDRLQLLRRAILRGRRVGEVSGLSNESLEALIREDDRAEPVVPPAPLPTPTIGSDTALAVRWPAIGGDRQAASVVVEEAMNAVRNLDAPRLDGILNRALLAAGATAFAEQIIGPLLRTIGEEWEKGRLDPYAEHFSIEIVRQLIFRVLFRVNPDASAPAAVVATPAGQRHDLGASLVACAAQAEGWRVVYLGADLPARDIARAAEQGRVEVVALSIVYPPDDPRLNAEFSELHRRLPKGVSVIVGGPAAPSYARTLRRIQAEIALDTASFRSALHRIRSDGNASRKPSD
jgi:MerR family transcriptional regulator, light-induced transcriptional regulator